MGSSADTSRETLIVMMDNEQSFAAYAQELFRYSSGSIAKDAVLLFEDNIGEGESYTYSDIIRVSCIDIAAELGEQGDVIIKWRDRLTAYGVGGLMDAARSGKPVTYGDEWKALVLKKLEEKPPNGLARWDGTTLAAELGTSEDTVQRFLQKEGIQLARMRTWCISTDPEFAAKAADVIGLYLNLPTDAIVVSIDEKPSIQALSRRVGVVRTSNGKTVSAVKNTYCMEKARGSGFQDK